MNGRGLDIRLRLPDQPDGLEGPIRKAVQDCVQRGNVTLALRLVRGETGAGAALNESALEAAVHLLGRAERAAEAAGLTLRETSAAELLGMRGVMDGGAGEIDTDALREALLASVPALLESFAASRAAEGAALAAILAAQIAHVAELVAAARALLPERSAAMAGTLQQAVQRLHGVTDGVDEGRLAQELALIGIKTDVAEELDRLDAHVVAARDLLAGPGPKGRKLDFLTQEFNREANTLCSKAQFAALTQIGLDLKHTIDQMREQVQNVE